MIDVSDGLVQDLGHVCRASGVAAEIEVGRVPGGAGVPARARRDAAPRSRPRRARTTSCCSPRHRAVARRLAAARTAARLPTDADRPRRRRASGRAARCDARGTPLRARGARASTTSADRACGSTARRLTLWAHGPRAPRRAARRRAARRMPGRRGARAAARAALRGPRLRARSTTIASLRNGFPEVVFGAGQDARADRRHRRAAGGGGRQRPGHAARARTRRRACVAAVDGFEYHPLPRLAVRRARPIEPRGDGTVLVVSAGTADLPVAEEAAITAELMGNSRRAPVRRRRLRAASPAGASASASGTRRC